MIEIHKDKKLRMQKASHFIQLNGSPQKVHGKSPWNVYEISVDVNQVFIEYIDINLIFISKFYILLIVVVIVKLL